MVPITASRPKDQSPQSCSSTGASNNLPLTLLAMSTRGTKPSSAQNPGCNRISIVITSDVRIRKIRVESIALRRKCRTARGSYKLLAELLIASLPSPTVRSLKSETQFFPNLRRASRETTHYCVREVACRGNAPMYDCLPNSRATRTTPSTARVSYGLPKVDPVRLLSSSLERPRPGTHFAGHTRPELRVHNLARKKRFTGS